MLARQRERTSGRSDGLHLAQRCESAQRVELDLADALAREAEPAADLLEGLRLRLVEPVTELEHLPLAVRQRRERLRERLAPERDLDLVLRKRPVAGDEVAEGRVLLVADRLVEAGGGPRRGEHLVRLLQRQARLFGDLLERRLAAELGPQEPLRAVHLLEPLDDVDGHPDRPRLVGKRPRDGLADPPGRVRGELVPAPPVELLDGADQPEGSFLDQVEEGQTLVAVVLRDRDDEAQVRLDHALLRLAVAPLDALRKLDLLRRREQRMATGFAQEELKRVGRRLVRELRRERRLGWGRRRLTLALLLDDLDPALVELAVERVGLERIERVRLEHLGEVGLAHGALELGRLDQVL